MAKITQAQFVCRFERHVRNSYRSMQKAADYYGVSRRSLYNVFDMKSLPNEKMQEDMGFYERKRVIINYEDKKND